VHEFDGGREFYVALAGVAGEVRHRQRQHRAQPFAARGDQVVGDLGDHGDFRAGPRQDGGVDALHIGGDKPDHLIDRRCRVALKRYDYRHAGLHICAIASILGYNNRNCGVTRQGHEAVDTRREAMKQTDRGAAELRELVRTNDIVLVSAIGALLDGANIHHLVLDQNMSIIEGSLGVLPRRILVHEDDNREARQVLTDAGLAHELRADD
jgi:hypothetical protein